MPKVFIASDHAGFELKEALVPFLQSLGNDVEDMGPYELDPEDDYPDYILPCARAVASAEDRHLDTYGIVLGGSGQGEAMAANRVPGARAMVFYGGSQDLVALARAHNDATILSLGARFLSHEEAKEAVRLFLVTRFSEDERHVRRIAKF